MCIEHGNVTFVYGFRKTNKFRYQANSTPTQPPVQCVTGVLFPGVKHGQGVTLTTHPHLLPWSRMSRSLISSHIVFSMAVAGKLYVCFRVVLQYT
jgi:hypothetical protein